MTPHGAHMIIRIFKYLLTQSSQDMRHVGLGMTNGLDISEIIMHIVYSVSDYDSIWCSGLLPMDSYAGIGHFLEDHFEWTTWH